MTAEVLFAGYKVVYSRKVALQHYRNWSEDPTSENYQWLKQRHEAAKVLYEERYGNQNSQELSGSYRMKTKVARRVKAGAKRYLTNDYVRTSAAVRTCFIILSSRYISILDPILTFGRDYHLVQKKDQVNYSNVETGHTCFEAAPPAAVEHPRGREATSCRSLNFAGSAPS